MPSEDVAAGTGKENLAADPVLLIKNMTKRSKLILFGKIDSRMNGNTKSEIRNPLGRRSLGEISEDDYDTHRSDTFERPSKGTVGEKKKSPGGALR